VPTLVTFSDLDRKLFCLLHADDIGVKALMNATGAPQTTLLGHLVRMESLGMVHTYLKHIDKRGRPPRFFGMTPEGRTFYEKELNI